MAARNKIEVALLDSARLASEHRSAAAIYTAAAGRGFLQPHLGDADQRLALFHRGLRYRNIIVALCDGHFAGFASYKYRGSGPMAPTLGDFIQTYGTAAFQPWFVYHFAEARLRSRGIYVCGIEVLPQFRRCGVGVALMAKLGHIALSLDAKVIELDVGTNNHVAQAFYQKLHFVPPMRQRLSFGNFNAAATLEYQRLALAVTPASDYRPCDQQGDVFG